MGPGAWSSNSRVDIESTRFFIMVSRQFTLYLEYWNIFSVCVCMFAYEDEHTYRYAYAHSSVHGCGGWRTTSGFSTGDLHLAFWDLRQHLSLTWNSSSRLVCLGVPVPVHAFPMLGLQLFIAVRVWATIAGMKSHFRSKEFLSLNLHIVIHHWRKPGQ